MTIWEVSNFSHGAHWDVALIEAETANEARALLLVYLADEDSDDRPDTVYGTIKPDVEWVVSRARLPLMFVLGAGCR